MVPKHWRAAGLAPQNLLFPTWLPGTAQNFTPAVIARQKALAQSDLRSCPRCGSKWMYDPEAPDADERCCES
jgi:hypothetical protein